MANNDANGFPAPQTKFFDLVLIKKSAGGAHVAKPEDFKRVRVEATDPFAAQTSDEGRAALFDSAEDAAKPGAEPTYLFLYTTNPDEMSDAEIRARSRAHQIDSIDRSKI